MRDVLFTIVLLSVVTPALAAPCAPPPAVTAYLAKHPGWAILDMSDLVADDQMIWHQYHKGKCPGLAEVVLDGSRKTSYAMALIDRMKGREQLVVLMPARGTFREILLAPPFSPAGSVVWRARPGLSDDMETGRRNIVIAHDSIIWEKMEAASQQFYLANGRFHKLQTSD